VSTLLKVRLRDLSNYSYLGIKVDRELANDIKNKLKLKFSSIEKASQLIDVSGFTIREIEKRNIRLYTWNKILESLDMSLDDIESHVVSVCDKIIYNIRFPYKITPLHMRLLSHIIGDGNYSEGSAYWIQKDVEPIIQLQKTLFGISGKRIIRPNVGCVSIRSFYIKLICTAIKLKRNEIKSKNFFDICLTLPKFYKIEAIAAILEDESKIQSESGTIRISLKEKKLIEGIARLFDSLDYERSKIKKIKNNGSFKSDSFLYSVFLRILGSHKFDKDLQTVCKKYGELANLWKKKEAFNELIRKNNGKKAKEREINTSIVKTLLNYQTKKVTAVQLMKDFRLTRQKADSIIRRLKNEKIVQRTKTGVYQLF